MSRKVAWVAFWMTLMFWLGGFWGCAGPGDDQNYEMLNEDDKLFEPEPVEPGGLQSREQIATELQVALDEPAEQPQEQPVDAPVENPAEAAPVHLSVEDPSPAGDQVASADSPQEPPIRIEPVLDAYEPGVVLTGYVRLSDLPADGPSVTGVARAHWTRTTVMPSYGTTVHNPRYFADMNVADKPTPAEHPQTPLDVRGADGLLLTVDAYDETQLAESLDGAKAGNLIHGTNASDLLWQPLKFGVDLVTLPVKAVIAPPLKPVTSPREEKPAPQQAEPPPDEAAPGPDEAAASPTDEAASPPPAE